MATKKSWKRKITDACKDAGTYKPFFDLVIGQLAEIMETKDTATDQFQLSGGNPVVTHTNKGGATNIVKNPALVVVMDCNAQALAYWRELGLTSKAYKQMSGALEFKEKEGALESFLANIGI